MEVKKHSDSESVVGMRANKDKLQFPLHIRQNKKVKSKKVKVKKQVKVKIEN